MLHVVRIRAAVSPDVAGGPAGRPDVVVAADRADVLPPGADADERGVLLVGDDLLGFVDVNDHLRAEGERATEGRHRLGLVENRFERVSGLDPVVVATVEQTDVVDAGVTKDQRRAARGDLSRPASRPLLIGMALGIAAIEDHGRVARDAKGPQGDLELLWGAAGSVPPVFSGGCGWGGRARGVGFLSLFL